MSQVDEIKSRIDIVELVSETVKLRRTGKNYSGLCPFHSEKTPSFIVSPDRQTWHCFGQCSEGGDVIKFVMKKEGWDFREALQHLAVKAGITLEAFTPQQQEEKDAHARLRTLLEDAAVFYRHQLLQGEAGKQALAYLVDKRKLTPRTIETFGMGYAPQGWDNILKHLAGKGFTEQEMQDSGMVSVRTEDRHTGGQERSRVFDRFRHRIMIPIRDEQGRMAGFGARILDPEDFPKFLNSPETPLFSKGRLLYGLERARKPIRTEDQAVIVEGYLDVIALHQAGFENVVSPMGTALTEDQLRLLKRFSRRIVLALDPDAAGQKAVLSGLEAARQSLDHASELRFDARGLLRNEARLQADLRVASMPDELDPDEIVQRDPQQWKDLIRDASPIVIHVMNTLAIGRDLDDARVKTEIAAQVMPLIEDLPDQVLREDYRQKLERFLKLRETTLVGYQGRGQKPRRSRPLAETGEAAPGTEPKPVVPASRVATTLKIEAHVLSLLFRRPDLLFRLDRALKESSLPHLADDDFSQTDHQLIFRLISQSIEQDASEPDRYLVEHLPESLASVAGNLLAGAVKLDPVDDRLLEDMFRGTLKIRRTLLSDRINQLRFLQEEAQQAGDLRLDNYRAMAQQYTAQLLLLDRAQIRKNGNREER